MNNLRIDDWNALYKAKSRALGQPTGTVEIGKDADEIGPDSVEH